MPNNKEIDTMLLEYDQWYNEYGDNYKSVGWNKPKHEIRFGALLKNWTQFDTVKQYHKNKIQILDLGCGLAHLNEFLMKNEIVVDYIGVDINQNFIELNSVKFKNQKFLLAAADDPLPSTDFIFASGLFNREFSDSEEFFSKTVRNMIMASKVGCSFNCLSEVARDKKSHNFYVSLAQIEALLDRDLVEHFNIDGQSVPGEITVHIHKVTTP